MDAPAAAAITKPVLSSVTSAKNAQMDATHANAQNAQNRAASAHVALRMTAARSKNPAQSVTQALLHESSEDSPEKIST